MVALMHPGCPPQCLSGVRRFICWSCGQEHGDTLHWQPGLPEFRQCGECGTKEETR